MLTRAACPEILQRDADGIIARRGADLQTHAAMDMGAPCAAIVPGDAEAMVRHEDYASSRALSQASAPRWSRPITASRRTGSQSAPPRRARAVRDRRLRSRARPRLHVASACRDAWRCES